MGQRNAGVGCATTGRGDTRHHLERDAVLHQRFDFFAAAAKDKWITALEPQDAFASLGMAHQLGVDPVLRHRVCAARLADIQSYGIAAYEFHEVGRNEEVVEHDIAMLKDRRSTRLNCSE